VKAPDTLILCLEKSNFRYLQNNVLLPLK